MACLAPIHSVELTALQLIQLILNQMNFFKRVLGIFPSLEEQLAAAKFTGTFFRVVGTNRSVVYRDCCITIAPAYAVVFSGEAQAYEFPIHRRMNLVSFPMSKSSTAYTCFQWELEDGEHIGCYMLPPQAQSFRQLFCKAIHAVVNDPLIRDPADLCRELASIPKCGEGESGLKVDTSQVMNKVVLAEAQREENKMVHPCTYAVVVGECREVVQRECVFVLRRRGSGYEFALVNMAGYAFVRKQLTSSLTYDVSTKEAVLKWLDLEQGYKIVQVGFNGRIDAVMSLKYNIMECLYEINTGKKMDQEVSPEEVEYLSKLNDPPEKIVKTYSDEVKIEGIVEHGFVYNSPQAKKGLERYRALCQGQVHEYSVSALGSMLQSLRISQTNEIVLSEKRTLVDSKSKEVQINNILLHDSDSKAMVLGVNGRLYYEDMVKNRLVNEWAPAHMQYICPEYKLRGEQCRTFKAISASGIYEFDPRTVDGVCSMKGYSGNPQFRTMSVDQRGHLAVGAHNGEIRLYKAEVGHKAMNKFSSTGEPVLHLDSTRDGKWLLATFPSHLRLLPTATEEKSMYDGTVQYSHRPDPIKLRVKMEDVCRYKVEEVLFVGAKFDESRSKEEKYIVSGFNQYTIVWNLTEVLRGNIYNYLVTKTEGELIQTDFKYDDPTRLIMTTTKGIVVKRNKINKK